MRRSALGGDSGGRIYPVFFSSLVLIFFDLDKFSVCGAMRFLPAVEMTEGEGEMTEGGAK